MKIDFFDKENPNHFEEATALLQENFDCWSDIQVAKEEIAEIGSSGNITLLAIADGQVIGLTSAHPHYNGNAWELHPIVIKKDKQKSGIGRC